jgi:hypothetical protein
MGKEDKIRNQAFQLERAKDFISNKTSIGRVIAFGCATRCHLSVHSLAHPRLGSCNDSCFVVLGLVLLGVVHAADVKARMKGSILLLVRGGGPCFCAFSRWFFVTK